MLPVSRERYNNIVSERDNLLEENQKLQEQTQSLETNVKNAETKNQELTEQLTELNRQITENEPLNNALKELEQAQQQISDFQNQNDANNVKHQNQIEGLTQKIQMLNDELAARPGTSPVQVLTKTDPPTETTDGVDWDTLNNLPHMKNALL